METFLTGFYSERKIVQIGQRKFDFYFEVMIFIIIIIIIVNLI